MMLEVLSPLSFSLIHLFYLNNYCLLSEPSLLAIAMQV